MNREEIIKRIGIEKYTIAYYDKKIAGKYPYKNLTDSVVNLIESEIEKAVKEQKQKIISTLKYCGEVLTKHTESQREYEALSRISKNIKDLEDSE